MAQQSTPGAGKDTAAGAAENQLIYVADPMCSWCWGFSPVIRKVHEAVKHKADLRLIMGGLRAGNTQPMDEGMSNYISSAWESVGQRTGAEFNHTFFERDSFIYDTEPACRAVVTLREQGASADDLLTFMAAIQKAFYADNRDITSAEVLADIASEVGEDRSEFLAAFDTQEMRDKTHTDFLTANQSGITGFPTLLYGDSDAGYQPLTTGYRAFEEIEPILDRLP